MVLFVYVFFFFFFFFGFLFGDFFFGFESTRFYFFPFKIPVVPLHEPFRSIWPCQLFYYAGTFLAQKPSPPCGNETVCGSPESNVTDVVKLLFCWDSTSL